MPKSRRWHSKTRQRGGVIADETPSLQYYAFKLLGSLPGKRLNLSVYASSPKAAELAALDSFAHVYEAEIIGYWYTDELEPKMYALINDGKDLFEVLVVPVAK